MQKNKDDRNRSTINRRCPVALDIENLDQAKDAEEVCQREMKNVVISLRFLPSYNFGDNIVRHTICKIKNVMICKMKFAIFVEFEDLQKNIQV